MLAKITKIVDYYKCTDAVSLHADGWIRVLKKTSLPRYYGQDAVMWIFVSQVFAEAEVFENMTALARNQSRGPLQTLGLPIAPHIIGTA